MFQTVFSVFWFLLNMDKGIAVVLARAGSKGLKDKNIRLLSGRPLIFHTLLLLASNNNIKNNRLNRWRTH